MLLGDTWSPLSPNKNLRAQLETTPYSTPGSTPSSTPVPASQHPRKTPIFITVRIISNCFYFYYAIHRN